jgi:hypothetical protein
MQVTVTVGDKDDDTSAAEARGAHSVVLPIEGQGRRKITINTSEIEDKVQTVIFCVSISRMVVRLSFVTGSSMRSSDGNY